MSVDVSFSSELKTPETIAWLALVAITCASWAMGSNPGAMTRNLFLESALLVVLAFFKVRLIILYFMEVRHGPVLLRLSCEAWLITSCLGMLFFLRA